MTAANFDVDMEDVLLLADALVMAKPSMRPKWLEDLKALYRNPEGFRCYVDARNRPQGRTIWSCRRIGSAIFKVLGENPKGYTMSEIGYCAEVNNEGRWLMQPTVRAALKRLGWFDESRNIPAPLPPPRRACST